MPDNRWSQKTQSTCSTKPAAPQTSSHTRTVAEYAREIAERYNERHRNHADIESVIAGALLYDIGRARSNGTDHAVAGVKIAQAFGSDMRIIKRHIGDGIPKDEAERLGIQREDYLPFTAMDCSTSVALEKQNQSRSGQLHS